MNDVRLVQVVVSFVLAEMDEDGDIGATSKPIQMVVSGSEWKKKWTTEHSSEVVEELRAAAVEQNGDATSVEPHLPPS